MWVHKFDRVCAIMSKFLIEIGLNLEEGGGLYLPLVEVPEERYAQ